MMGHFVNDRPPNLAHEFVLRATSLFDWPSKKRDAVGQDQAIVAAALSQRYSLVKTEKCVVWPYTRFSTLFWRGIVRNEHVDVLHVPGNLGGEAPHRTRNETLESVPATRGDLLFAHLSA
jgi:hypothetical protein